MLSYTATPYVLIFYLYFIFCKDLFIYYVYNILPPCMHRCKQFTCGILNWIPPTIWGWSTWTIDHATSPSPDHRGLTLTVKTTRGRCPGSSTLALRIWNSRPWWHTPLILVFGRRRLGGSLRVQGQSGLQSEFQGKDSQSCEQRNPVSKNKLKQCGTIVFRLGH